MTIKQRLLIGFLAVSLIPIFMIGFIPFSSARKALEQAQISSLESIADLKVNKIEAFFHERAGDIKTAQDDFNIKTNLPVLTRFADHRTHPDYISAKQMLDGQLQTFQKVNGYLDVLLVSPEGRIVYVTNEQHRAADVGNMLPDPDNKTFEEGQKGIYFSDIFINKVDGNRFGMFVTAPVHDFDGSLIGMIALEVAMDSIYRFIQETTGLGQTGETLVGLRVGHEALFLNPLRHDQNAALKRRVTIGSQTAIPIQKAVEGQNGSGRSIDYRGEEIIAVWRAIPSMNWGMVAKIDIKEAFASVDDLRRLTLGIALMTLLLVVFVARATARSIARPIRVLQQGVETLGNGDLSFKVGTDAKDEVGQLSRAFDQMVGDLKVLNLKLEKRADELARSNEDLEQFTSIASHDLQEPLRKMRSFSSILKEDYSGSLDGEGLGFLDRIQHSSDRMKRLIDDLLSLSRVTTKAKSFQSTDLKKVAEEVIDDIDDLISRSNGHVEIGDLPTIEADRTQMYHLIQNLIGNGLKYRQKNQAPEISVENVPGKNGNVEIRVKDNGIGFDEKYLDRIFKPFQRLHGRKDYEGSGIGLAICEKIVRRHEGEMTAQSSPGQGATFIVKLPRHPSRKKPQKIMHSLEG